MSYTKWRNQLYGRNLISGHRSLVKRRWEKETAVVVLDSPGTGPVVTSPRQLARNFPQALATIRRTGNQILDYQELFAEPFESRDEAIAANDVFEYLTSRLPYNRFPTHIRPVIGGQRQEDIFDTLLRNLEAAIYVRDTDQADALAVKSLNIFQMLSKALGYPGGLSFELFDEIMDNALRFAPIVADLDPVFTFHLVQPMYRMTGHDPRVVRRLIEGIGLDQREDLFQVVLRVAEDDGNYLAYDIAQILQGSDRSPARYPAHFTAMNLPGVRSSMPWV